MAPHRSLDVSKVIAAMLHDVQNVHDAVFNRKSLRDTLSVFQRRFSSEGMGFLTKTLPKLGKALDRALAGDTFDCSKLRFKTQPRSKLPKLFGELFNRIFTPEGVVLQASCTQSVGILRDICYLFNKYELANSEEQEQAVILKFKQTEETLITTVDPLLESLRHAIDGLPPTPWVRDSLGNFRHPAETQLDVAREASALLQRLFASFDPNNIYPQHGPGAVATRQSLWGKYIWTNVSAKLTERFPYDQYFCAGFGHVCDEYRSFSTCTEESLPARVVLVPKDSRGPRLISCEPIDHQWIQQGLRKAIVALVEHHPLTKDNVFFSTQMPNQRGALLGSSSGRYATLDLNEASDRVSLELVRLLFPASLVECLEACRSSSTVLPNGEVLPLRKFAPMGSSLCFPIMALVIWSVLTAAAPDQDTRDSILVYGDDVIVPTAYAVNAMEVLESFGLKINHDKSFIKGFFRESCGVDAFQGVCVTPIRIRTVWSSSRTPDSYESWIAYANSMYRKNYRSAGDYIASAITSLYGVVPTTDMDLPCPSLDYVPEQQAPLRRRTNHFLQQQEWNVWVPKAPVIQYELPGWNMLLRYFTEGCPTYEGSDAEHCKSPSYEGDVAFSVRSYTRRNSNILVRRWVRVFRGKPRSVWPSLSVLGPFETSKWDMQLRSCISFSANRTTAIRRPPFWRKRRVAPV